MKPFYKIYHCLLIVFSCSCSHSQKMDKKINFDFFSENQRKLELLANDYKEDYFKFTDTNYRRKVRLQYENKLSKLLYDTIGNHIDSMKLIVDTIIEKNLNLNTNFHSEGLKFSFTMQYLRKMNPAQTEEYIFFRNLKKGDSISTNFIFLGGFKVENPQNKTDMVFKIFAYPVTPTSQKKFSDTLNSIEKKRLVDGLEKTGAIGI